MNKRSVFDAAFKLEVIRTGEDPQLSVPEVLRTLGIGQTAIRR